MSGRIAGKIAIVTGAGSGIGRAIAHRFAREGAKVVVADVSGNEEQVAREIGPEAFPYRLDVQVEAQIADLIATTVARFGRLDILCNNAGSAGELVALHETPTGMVDDLLRVNLRGAFLVMRKSIEQMLLNGGGAIVNTASVASFQSTPGHGIYSATKGGVLAMTRAAAVEYGDRNIRVNALCPGPVETPMIADVSEDVKAKLRERVPLRRFGTPAEMASVALFLASEDASYVTGIGLVVDGGRIAGAL